MGKQRDGEAELWKTLNVVGKLNAPPSRFLSSKRSWISKHHLISPQRSSTQTMNSQRMKSFFLSQYPSPLHFHLQTLPHPHKVIHLHPAMEPLSTDLPPRPAPPPSLFARITRPCTCPPARPDDDVELGERAGTSTLPPRRHGVKISGFAAA
jgi:hypothetical protein